jgi:hypothetical protein
MRRADLHRHTATDGRVRFMAWFRYETSMKYHYGVVNMTPSCGCAGVWPVCNHPSAAVNVWPAAFQSSAPQEFMQCGTCRLQLQRRRAADPDPTWGDLQKAIAAFRRASEGRELEP